MAVAPHGDQSRALPAPVLARDAAYVGLVIDRVVDGTRYWVVLRPER